MQAPNLRSQAGDAPTTTGIHPDPSDLARAIQVDVCATAGSGDQNDRPPRAQVPPWADSKPLSILIVEDEPGDHALIATYLRHRSFLRSAGAPSLVWAQTLG